MLLAVEARRKEREMTLKVLFIVLNIALIVTLKSWYDRNRIAKGQHVYHGWEISVAIAWGLFFTWLIGASWRTIFLQCAIFWVAFDGSINLGRGKAFFYIGSSWNDLLFKKLFGKEAEVIMAVCKLIFLVGSIWLLVIKEPTLR